MIWAALLALATLGDLSDPPTRDYLVLVASESADQMALVRFGPSGIKVERTRYVGWLRNEIARPYGVGLSPDGKHYFVTTAHGVPFGFLQKYAAANDSLEGSVTLGNFPATVQVSPDGYYVYVANFNFHGDRIRSSVSVVAADEMIEIARIETCTMSHGSRLTKDGAKHYSTSMMDEALVEIDTRTMTVARHFLLTPGREMGVASGRELARIPTTRKLVHGVAISDDDRYAFISIEGSGAQPGTMDVIDLGTLTRVASIDLGPQAVGIDFRKSEAPR